MSELRASSPTPLLSHACFHMLQLPWPPHPLNLPHLPLSDHFACILSVSNALFPQNHIASGLYLNVTFYHFVHIRHQYITPQGLLASPISRALGHQFCPSCCCSTRPKGGFPPTSHGHSPAAPPLGHTICLLPYISGLPYLCKIADATG